MLQLLGYLLIMLAIADFFAANVANINLTYFMGPLSSFSPIILFVSGAILASTGEKGITDLFEGQDDESFIEEKPKKKRKKKNK